MTLTTYEFTCSDDGHSFQVATEDPDEVVSVVQQHAEQKHDMSMSEKDVRDGLTEVEV